MFRRLQRFLKLYFVAQPSLIYLFLFVRQFFSSAATDAQTSVKCRRGRTILFVDGSTPRCDRDAGAVSIIQFMQLFADHGWEVHFWPFDQSDHPQARSDLERKGLHVILSSKRVDAFRTWITRNSDLYEIVFVSRPAIAAYLLPALRHGKAKLAYYGHDLHGERFRQEASLTGHRELLVLARQYNNIERRICASAHCSYYPSSQEAEAIKIEVPGATIRELPPYAFDDVQLLPPQRPANVHLLFVGNFGHVPNLDAAIWLLDEIWPCIKDRLPRAQLTIAGARPPASLIKRAQAYGGDVMVTGWITDEQLNELYRTSLIVVVPLRFGAGVKHKVVAAIMKGCPVVTTEVGLQGLPELEGVVGLANNSYDFAQECERLAEENELWFSRVSSAQKLLSIRFSCDSMWRALQDLHHDL